MTFERTSFEFGHQFRDLRSRCKREGVLLHVHRAIFSRPRINPPQPESMHATNISGRESMIAVIETCQLFKHAYLFTPFHPIHLTLARDTKQILEHAAARSRLKLVLSKVGRI